MAKVLSFKFLRDLIFAQTEHAQYKMHVFWKLHVFKISRFLTFAKIKSQQTFPDIRYIHWLICLHIVWHTYLLTILLYSPEVTFCQTRSHNIIVAFTLLCYSRPLIEMSIPSSLDPTLAPSGCHVASLFTQYTPYNLKFSCEGWTEEMKKEYGNLGKCNYVINHMRFLIIMIIIFFY